VSTSGAEPREDAPAARGDAGDGGTAAREAAAGDSGTAAREDAAPQGDAMARGYARSRAKTEAIQAQLTPLGPDERPLGIKLAVALAVFIALASFVGAAFGAGGESPAVGVVWAVAMLGLAAGLWARIYIVLLLFQALLAISIIVSALSLAFASNLLGVLVAVAVIAACSPVFWLLIRVMARLQVPRE
jgi:hypothetical protein